MNLVRRAAQQVGAGLSLSDFDKVLDQLYGGSPSYTGKMVSQTTALAVRAVWACIAALADDIATLPLRTYRQIEPGGAINASCLANAGRELARDHYLWALLQEEANGEMTAFRFKQLMQTWILLWGNAIAEIEISGRGQVIGLWPWRPDRVTISRAVNGQLQYTYRMKSGEPVTLPHLQILHLRGMGIDGVTGLSPIDVHKQKIGLSMAIEEHGARYFSNGARPLGVLRHPGKLGEVAYARVAKDWSSEHRGLDNAHRVAILEEGMEWSDAGANMVDAAYIESQRLTQEDIASIYKVPGHRIGLLAQATNNNIEELALEYVGYSLAPWCENWKQEIGFALLSPYERQTISVDFNFQRLLRGDHASMGRFIATLRQWGLASADEIRDEFLDWNPLPDGRGQSTWTPVNMAVEGDGPTNEPAPIKGKPNGKPNGKANGLLHQ